MTPWDCQSRRVYRSNGVYPTLKALGGKAGADVEGVLTFAQNQRDEVRILDGVAGALAARPGVKQQTFVADARAVYCASDSGTNSSVNLDIAPTLTVHDSKSASYVSLPKTLQVRSGKEGGGKGALVQDDMSATLTCGLQQTLFPGNGSVRRLTPLECERLQGFPDGWTDIPYRGKNHASDSARYKALGNSMAVPVMQWIGRRIKEVAS